MSRYPILLALAITILPAAARAQARWADVGPTTKGDMVSVDTTSLERTGDLVAGEVRVVYAKPVETNGERWASLSAKATFDCARGIADVQEMTTYADVRSTHVIQRGKPAISRPGTPPKGSLWEVAMGRLCADRVPSPETKTP